LSEYGCMGWYYILNVVLSYCNSSCF